MKRIVLALALASAVKAYAVDVPAAAEPEACGPMPDAYQECAYGDAECAMAVMARALKIHNCRMRALEVRAALPVPVPKTASGAAP